jgi:ATP-dependent Lon protease
MEMKLPCEVPVMTLPNATLFPQALLPLYIFEPRYRRMLKDALHADRMFSVAMQKPGRVRENPSPIAGLGLIRVAVGHNAGTSHLILQGLARVELGEAVRYKPYRIHRIRPIEAPPCDTLAVHALVDRLRELLEQRVKLGLAFQFPVPPSAHPASDPPGFSSKDVLRYLRGLKEPAEVADLASCAVLANPVERQTLLETVNVEARLRQLIHFLMAEMGCRGEDGQP